MRRSWLRRRSFATVIRQASRYSIGGMPTMRVKRSKKAERDNAAVRATRPYGVDVASGVEVSPGVKDADAVRAFVRAVKTLAWE